MKDWRANRVVIQAIIEWPDGTTREALFQAPADAFGKPGGEFKSAQVFVAHEREAAYDMKLHTTEGTTNAKRGSTISYAGEPCDIPVEAPRPGVSFDHARLKVIPAPPRAS